MGIKASKADILRWEREGLIASPNPSAGLPLAKKASKPRNRKPLAVDQFIAPSTWLVGVRTVSESNQREHWTIKNRRKCAQQLIVNCILRQRQEALDGFAEHYAAGGILVVRLCRLGGQRLDATNLPVAFKGIEDQLALILGANDGDPRWDCSVTQEAFPAIGIRITLEKA